MKRQWEVGTTGLEEGDTYILGIEWGMIWDKNMDSKIY